MAYNFSANQFEKAYKSRRLGNWELPHWYPPHPRQHCGSTKPIANPDGRLLKLAERVPCGKSCECQIRNCCVFERPAWSHFRHTFDLPQKITRKFCEEYHKSLNTREKWKFFPPQVPGVGLTGRTVPKKCKSPKERAAKAAEEQAALNRSVKEKGEEKDANIPPPDFKYVPGDYTPAKQQHESRDFLLKNHGLLENDFPLKAAQRSRLEDDYRLQSDQSKRFEKDFRLNSAQQKRFAADNPLKLPERGRLDTDYEPRLPLNKLNIDYDHDCTTKNCKDYKETFSAPIPLTASLTKPLVSPPVPDDYNFSTDIGEPKMPIISQHSITEKPNERCPSPVVPAYANFEQAKRMHHDNLDHQPLPDCIADIAYRRQQITGANPGLALDIDPIATGVGVRTHNAGPTHCIKMKVYRPKTCGIVPKVYNTDAAYRDITSAQSKKMGAMDLAICWDYRPANPADEPQRSRHIDGSSDTAGPAVFTCVKTPRDNGPSDVGRSAGVFNSTAGELSFFDKDILRRKTDFGGRKVGVVDTFASDNEQSYGGQRGQRQTNSASQHYLHRIGADMPNRYDKQYQSSPNITDRELENLRKRYLMGGEGTGPMPIPMPDKGLACGDPPCKRQNPNFLQRAKSRLCHKIAPEPISCCHEPPDYPRPLRHCKAFRVGIPKFSSTGEVISADMSGCGMMGHHHSHKVLVVPRPRDPYAKKNYNIDTLVPPFTSIKGGANDGGYPEHWRLASVYQHAYKPIKQRKKPLLQTVYK